jgi:hypothetical protein
MAYQVHPEDMRIAYNRKRKRFLYPSARKHALSPRSGQSIIESCLVVGLICVVFMIMLQVAELTAAREVLSYAAACSARCRTVGFNQFMVWKTSRVASIPNAGKITVPGYVNADANIQQKVANLNSGDLFVDVAGNPAPASGQYEIERARIPDYMGAGNMSRAEYYLNYSNWESIVVDPGPGQIGDGTLPQILHVTARQNYNLWVPLHRTFYAGDTVSLEGTADIESHYPLYIDDQSY